MLLRLIKTILLFAAVAIAFPAAAQTADYAVVRTAETAQEVGALDAAARATCDQRLVLLGENGFHGDGRTSAFKADLVRRLVTECGFDAVVFEGSLYDFTALTRAIRRGDATPEMMSSAVGGLWNQNREVQALIGFLFNEARAGRVRLAGMDDQLGSRGAFYSLEAMPQELADFLPDGRREDCAVRLKQRIWSRYSSIDPYTEANRTELRACLSEIDGAVRGAPLAAADRVELGVMIAGYGRAMDRDFMPPQARAQGRDRDMFLNLDALIAELPADAKVVVWSANSHVARDTRALELYADADNLGSLVDRSYGVNAYVVGFTAAGGSYRYNVRTPRDISRVAPDSIEAQALADPGTEVAWISPQTLADLSPGVASAFDDHQPKVANWTEIFDGMVVFRTERPPYRLDE